VAEQSPNAIMDRVWVSEKMIRILCSPTMHDAAHAFANELYHAIWKQREGSEMYWHLAGRSFFRLHETNLSRLQSHPVCQGRDDQTT
jgi:hypothetical protein